jgi:ShK domain-like
MFVNEFGPAAVQGSDPATTQVDVIGRQTFNHDVQGEDANDLCTVGSHYGNYLSRGNGTHDHAACDETVFEATGAYAIAEDEDEDEDEDHVEGSEDEDEDDDDDVEECYDMHEQCAEWAATGRCSKTPSFMETYCELSCGVCDSQSDYPGVADMSSRMRYRTGADLGVPQKLSFGDGTEEEDIQRVLIRGRGYMSQVVRKKFGEGMMKVCRNTHEHCSWWALVGECKRNSECKCYCRLMYRPGFVCVKARHWLWSQFLLTVVLIDHPIHFARYEESMWPRVQQL